MEGRGGCCLLPSRWRTDGWKGAEDAACFLAGGGQSGGRVRGMLPASWQVEDRGVEVQVGAARSSIAGERQRVEGHGGCCLLPTRWRTDGWKGAGDAACSMAGGGQSGGRVRGMLPASWQVEDRGVEGRGGAACSLAGGGQRGRKVAGDVACSLAGGGQRGGRARGMLPAPSQVEDRVVEVCGDAACSLAGGGQRGGRARGMLPAP